jgi:hypothetical protein
VRTSGVGPHGDVRWEIMAALGHGVSQQYDGRQPVESVRHATTSPAGPWCRRPPTSTHEPMYHIHEDKLFLKTDDSLLFLSHCLIWSRGVFPLARETTQSWWSLGPSQIHPLGYPGAYLYGDFHCTLGYQSGGDAHPGLPTVRHRGG